MPGFFPFFRHPAANILLKIAGKDTDVDDTYFSEDKVMSMLDRGQESGEIKEEGRKYEEDRRLHNEKYSKWGIINEEGEEVLPVEYDEVWGFMGRGYASTNVEKDGVTRRVYFSDLISSEAEEEAEDDAGVAEAGLLALDLRRDEVAVEDLARQPHAQDADEAQEAAAVAEIGDREGEREAEHGA